MDSSVVYLEREAYVFLQVPIYQRSELTIVRI